MGKKGISVDDELIKRAIANGARVQDTDGNDITDDDEFLNQYAVATDDGEDDKERLKEVVSEIGEGPVSDSDTTALSEYAAQATPTEQAKLRKLQAQADKAEIDTDRARNRQELDELAQRKNLRDANQSNTQEVLSTINEKVATPLVNKGQSAIQKIGSLPTVGSIVLLLTLLLILLFVVVNVDGKGTTRIKQVWYMLMGRATLSGRVNVTKGSSGNTNPNPPGNDMGGGTLPKPGTSLAKLNKSKFIADDATLMKDVTLGDPLHPNLDLVDTAQAIGINFALRQAVDSGNAPEALNQFNQLQTTLNKMNNQTYNTDYNNIYRDAGF